MAALLSVGRQRTLARILMVHMMLLVTQVVAFSWHGAYKSAPPSSQSVAYSGWQPETFWWRSRRRTASPAITAGVSEGGSFGQKNSHYRPAISQPSGSEGGRFLDLDNSIANMGQPAFAAPRLHKERVGWGFLGPVHKPRGSPSTGLQGQHPHYVSLHYSTPVFGSLGAMNRRNKLNIVKDELDQEVMKNVIKQVIDEERHHEERLSMKTPAAIQPNVLGSSAPVVSAPRGLASGHRLPAPAGGNTLPRQNPRSPSQGSSPTHTYSVLPGAGDTFLPAQDSFSDGFSSLGFGSFVEPGADFSGGFGQPVVTHVQGQKNGASSHFGGGDGDSHSALGFEGFGQVDTAVGQFGWREPQSMGVEGHKSDVIKPIPTAMPASLGAFSQDDKDCDSILTKSCTDDSGCQCYGFYFCNSSGKCEDITSTAPDDSAAMTFGEQWHDGPAKTLGLTGRR